MMHECERKVGGGRKRCKRKNKDTHSNMHKGHASEYNAHLALVLVVPCLSIHCTPVYVLALMCVCVCV